MANKTRLSQAKNTTICIKMNYLNFFLLVDSVGHSVLALLGCVGCVQTPKEMSNPRSWKSSLPGNKAKMKSEVVSVVVFYHSVFAQSWKKQNLVCEVLEGPYQDTLCSHWAIFDADSLGMFGNPKFSCGINPPPTQRDTNKQTKQNKTSKFKSSKSGKDTKRWNWKNQLKAASTSHGKP